MTKIQVSERCGNSPKNRLSQDLAVAIASADSERVLELVTEDVRWSLVGKTPVLGAQSVARALVRSGAATSVTVSHVVSHGRSGAVDGIVTIGKKQRAFCHVFEFGSAKGTNVSAITTYSIDLERA